MVLAEKFKWTRYTLAQIFTVPPTRVGRTGLVNRVSFSSEETAGSLEDCGLEHDIPISDIEEAAPMCELMRPSSVPPSRLATARGWEPPTD